MLEGLYASKIQESSQAETIMALYNQESLRGGGQRDYHALQNDYSYGPFVLELI